MARQDAVLRPDTGPVGVEVLLNEAVQLKVLERPIRTRLGEILLDDLAQQRAFRTACIRDGSADLLFTMIGFICRPAH